MKASVVEQCVTGKAWSFFGESMKVLLKDVAWGAKTECFWKTQNKAYCVSKTSLNKITVPNRQRQYPKKTSKVTWENETIKHCALLSSYIFSILIAVFRSDRGLYTISSSPGRSLLHPHSSIFPVFIDAILPVVHLCWFNLELYMYM